MGTVAQEADESHLGRTTARDSAQRREPAVLEWTTVRRVSQGFCGWRPVGRSWSGAAAPLSASWRAGRISRGLPPAYPGSPSTCPGLSGRACHRTRNCGSACGSLFDSPMSSGAMLGRGPACSRSWGTCTASARYGRMGQLHPTSPQPLLQLKNQTEVSQSGFNSSSQPVVHHTAIALLQLLQAQASGATT